MLCNALSSPLTCLFEREILPVHLFLFMQKYQTGMDIEAYRQALDQKQAAIEALEAESMKDKAMVQSQQAALLSLQAAFDVREDIQDWLEMENNVYQLADNARLQVRHVWP